MNEAFATCVREIENAITPWNRLPSERKELFEEIVEILCRAQAHCDRYELVAFNMLDLSTREAIISLYITEKADTCIVNEWLADQFADDLHLLLKRVLSEEPICADNFRKSAIDRFENLFINYLINEYQRSGGRNAYDSHDDDEIKLSKEA